MSSQNRSKRLSKHRQRVIESMNSDSITKCEKEMLGNDIVVLPRRKDAIWTKHAKKRLIERKPKEGKKLVKRYATDGDNVITTVFYKKESKKPYDKKKKQSKIEEDKKHKQKLGKGKNKHK